VLDTAWFDEFEALRNPLSLTGSECRQIDTAFIRMRRIDGATCDQAAVAFDAYWASLIGIRLASTTAPICETICSRPHHGATTFEWHDGPYLSNNLDPGSSSTTLPSTTGAAHSTSVTTVVNFALRERRQRAALRPGPGLPGGSGRSGSAIPRPGVVHSGPVPLPARSALLGGFDQKKGSALMKAVHVPIGRFGRGSVCRQKRGRSWRYRGARPGARCELRAA